MADVENVHQETDPEATQLAPAAPTTLQAPTPSKSHPAGQQPGDIQTYIGARLRQAFDDVAQQPVPDRFLQLMAELDRS